MPPPYSRNGLRGWISTVSTRFRDFFLPFSLYRKIGLTWLTSTPLTLTGSRAEACQPLGVIRAVCQRHGDKGAGILDNIFCGPMGPYPHHSIPTKPLAAP